MAVLIGIVILAAVIIYMNRMGTGPARLPGQGRRVAKQTCEWMRVNPEETRTLKEYRCSRCNEVAYGRGENPPTSRACRAG